MGLRNAPTGVPPEGPLVSVIIPTCDHAHYLPESIGSTLAQSYRHFELIVIDDGSRDDTHAVVQRCNDGSIRYIKQRNRGLAAARNRGLSEARGEFAAFLDADDRLLPDHLRVSVAAFGDNAGVAFVCGDLRTFGFPHDFDHVHVCAPAPDHFASLLRGCFIVNVGVCLFRRSALLAVGGFDETRRACEDWDLFLRLLRHSSLFCHHTVVLEYRRSPGQMSRKFPLMLDESMRTLRGQRKYAQRRKEYADAYQDGLADILRYYGDPAADELRQAFSRLRIPDVLPLIRSLLRWYPAGFCRAVGLSSLGNGSRTHAP